MSGLHTFSAFMRLREIHPEQYHHPKTQRYMYWSYKHLGSAYFDRFIEGAVDGC